MTRHLTVEIPDDDDAEVTVRALTQMLSEGSRVVLLRRPVLPDHIWIAVSHVLVARAVAALHGQAVPALVGDPEAAVN